MPDLAALEMRIGYLEAEQASKRLDELEKTAKRVESAVDSMGNRSTESGKKLSLFERQVGGVARQLRDFFSVIAAAATVREGFNALTQYEVGLSRVEGQLRLTGQTAEEQVDSLKRVGEAARDISFSSEFTGAEATAGLEKFLKVGLEVEDSVQATKAAMDLAEVSGIELSQSYAILSRVIRQFNLEGHEAEAVVDALTVASQRTGTEIDGLATAMAHAGPTAKSLGVDFKELASVIGVLGALPGRAAVAGTTLRDVLLTLASPSATARQRLKELGIGIEELNPRTHSLVEIIYRLRQANLDVSDATAIFGESTGASLSLLTENADKIAQLVEEQRDNIGVTRELAAVYDDNLIGALEDLRGSFDALLAGQTAISGGLRSVIVLVTDVVRVLGGAEEPLGRSTALAHALADGLRAAALAALAFFGIGLIVKIGAFVAGLFEARVAVLALGAALQANPFTAFLSIAGSIAAALLLIRNSATDAGKELDKVLDDEDIREMEAFTERLKNLEGAFLRALETKNIARQIDTLTSLRDNIETKLEDLAAGKELPQFAKPHVLTELFEIDPEDTTSGVLKSIATLRQIDPIELKLEFDKEVVEKDILDLAQAARKKIEKFVSEGPGGFIAALQGKDSDSPGSKIAGALKSDRLFEPGVLIDKDRGALESVGILREGDAARGKLIGTLKNMVKDVEGSGIDDALAAQLDAVLVEYITKEKQIVSVSRQNLKPFLEKQQAQIQQKIEAATVELKKLPEEGKAPEAGSTTVITEEQRRARKELEVFIRTRQEELRVLTETKGLVGEEASKVKEAAEAQQLLSQAGISTTESIKASNSETEKLLDLLAKSDKDPDALKAFNSGLEDLISRTAEAKKAQAATSSEAGARGFRDGALSLGELVAARVADASAMVEQGRALQPLADQLKAERTEIERGLGLTIKDAEAVESLGNAERFLAQASRETGERRQGLIDIAAKEITKSKAVLDIEERVAKALGEQGNAARDSLQLRADEITAVTAGQKSLEGFVETLAAEQEAREKRIKLSQQDASNLRRLGELEKRTEQEASSTKIFGKDSTSETIYRQEIEQLRVSLGLQDEHNLRLEREGEIKKGLVDAITSRRRENEQLEDSIDLQKGVSEARREEIALRQSERLLKGPDRSLDNKGIKDLVRLLGEAITRGVSLTQVLDDVGNTRSNFISAIQGLEQQNEALVKNTALLTAKSKAERDAIVSTPGQQSDPAALAKLSLEELEEVVRALLKLNDDLQTEQLSKNITLDIESETEALRLNNREREVAMRLRGQETKLTEEQKEAIEQLVAELRKERGLDRIRSLREEVKILKTREGVDRDLELIKQDPSIDFDESGEKEARSILETIKQIKDLQFIAGEIARSFSDAFTSIVFDAEDLGSALKSVFRRISQAFLEVVAFKPFESFLQNLFASAIPTPGPKAQALGGVYGDSPVLAFSRGAAMEQPRRAGPIQRQMLKAASVVAFALGGTFEIPKTHAFARGGVSLPPTQAVEEELMASPFAKGGSFDPVRFPEIKAFAVGEAFSPAQQAVVATTAIPSLPLAKGGAFPSLSSPQGSPSPLPQEAFALGGAFRGDSPAISPQIAAERASAPIRAFARGNPFINSVVNKPTLAPLALFGEAGPEAIMPLRRGDRGLGISAFLGGREVALAPLRRGTDRRLGIDIDSFAKNLDALKLPQAKQPKAFALGASFTRTIASETMLNAPVARFERGGIMAIRSETPVSISPFQFGGLIDDNRAPLQSQSQALAAATTINRGGDSNEENTTITIESNPTYVFQGNQSPDQAFRTAARQHETDLRDNARRTFPRGRR